MSGAGQVLAPTTTDDVREAVRDAIAHRSPLRIVGAGTWLDAGRPVWGDATPLELRGLSGIVEYTPGDLVLTARAGTTLAEIEEATRAAGQWLTLDPFGSGAGTLGATVATASAGPLAQAFGRPRDIVLGVEVVAGDGAVVRAGGRVVKNVAGFDLTRLTIGAWGTLGVVTEISVRLRARPERDETVVVATDTDRGSIDALVDALRATSLAPIALELVSAPLARTLALGERAVLLARFAGNADLLAAQRDAVRRLGEAREADPGAWARLRACEPAGASVVRLSQLPSRFGETWGAAEAMAAHFPGALVHASVGRGVARVIAPAAGADDLRASQSVVPAGVHRIFERLPAALWAELAPSAAADPLSVRIRHAFDPKRILNPGILGEPTLHD